jgi:type VI protein secretion system component VasK
VEAVGGIPFVLGLLVVALGFLWQLFGYMFGGAVFVWSLMWGLMSIGLGLVLMGTSRRCRRVRQLLVTTDYGKLAHSNCAAVE